MITQNEKNYDFPKMGGGERESLFFLTLPYWTPSRLYGRARGRQIPIDSIALALAIRAAGVVENFLAG